jgi:hypothetical protein
MLQQQREVLHACRRKVLMNVCNIIFMAITLCVPLTGIGASHVDETVVTHDHSCAYEPLPAASCNHHEPRSNATRAATTNQDGTVPTTLEADQTICYYLRSTKIARGNYGNQGEGGSITIPSHQHHAGRTDAKNPRTMVPRPATPNGLC